MNQIRKVVLLQLQTNEVIAREIAYAVMERANPHGQTLIDRDLDKMGITVDTLTRYFVELSGAVASFWQSQWDVRHTSALKPHEMRGLYLPLMYSVVLSQVGNISVGNYSYRLITQQKGVVDKDFLLEFSGKLEASRQYIKGDVGQLGNRNVQVNDTMMMCLLGSVAEMTKEAEVFVRDGVIGDDQLRGLAALVGLTLVDECNAILYTGLDNVNFREVVSGIKQNAPEKSQSVDA